MNDTSGIREGIRARDSVSGLYRKMIREEVILNKKNRVSCLEEDVVPDITVESVNLTKCEIENKYRRSQFSSVSRKDMGNGDNY